MKKLFLVAGSIVFLASCNMHNYLPGFDFALFKNTPVWKLAKAVEKEDTNQIAEILKDTNIKIDYPEPKIGNTLLMLAVVNNEKKSVKKLLELGADPNKRDLYDNGNALIYSCNGGYVDGCDTDILKLLIQYGGNVNARQRIDRGTTDVKETVLMIASGWGCLEKVKILVEAGADINQYTYHNGYGAITNAWIQDHLEIAKYLIIDRQAKIPEYCYIRKEGEKDEQKLTITDMLNEKHYDIASTNYKYKEEILNYLKSKGLK